MNLWTGAETAGVRASHAQDNFLHQHPLCPISESSMMAARVSGLQRFRPDQPDEHILFSRICRPKALTADRHRIENRISMMEWSAQILFPSAGDSPIRAGLASLSNAPKLSFAGACLHSPDKVRSWMSMNVPVNLKLCKFWPRVSELLRGNELMLEMQVLRAIDSWSCVRQA